MHIVAKLYAGSTVLNKIFGLTENIIKIEQQKQNGDQNGHKADQSANVERRRHRFMILCRMFSMKILIQAILIWAILVEKILIQTILIQAILSLLSFGIVLLLIPRRY